MFRTWFLRLQVSVENSSQISVLSLPCTFSLIERIEQEKEKTSSPCDAFVTSSDEWNVRVESWLELNQYVSMFSPIGLRDVNSRLSRSLSNAHRALHSLLLLLRAKVNAHSTQEYHNSRWNRSLPVRCSLRVCVNVKNSLIHHRSLRQRKSLPTRVN